MAKRFTDTLKWTKVWIRKLKPVEKCFLFYLWDNCSNAGIWTVDFETADYYIGAKVPRHNPFPPDFPIIPLDEGKKWYMSTFLEFQQPNGLQANNRAHSGIIAELKRWLIDYENIGAFEGLPSPLEGGQVKVKVKVKETVKEEGQNWSQHIPVAPEIRHLWKVITEECPAVFSMAKPLTPVQLYAIAKKYPFDKIVAVFRAMANKPTLTKDYVSAHLTANNWLARDKKPEDRPMLKPQEVEPEIKQDVTDNIMLKSTRDLYENYLNGSDITTTPGHYQFMVRKGWVEAGTKEITYQGKVVCNKKEVFEEAKNDLTILRSIAIFADPKQRAQALSVKYIFDAFKEHGTPW